MNNDASLVDRKEHSAKSPVSIHDLTVAYHRKPVLWDIDLDIPEGQLVCIVGPNGAGKSTLIKAAMDLIPKASGLVQIYGKPFKQQRHLTSLKENLLIGIFQ